MGRRGLSEIRQAPVLQFDDETISNSRPCEWDIAADRHPAHEECFGPRTFCTASATCPIVSKARAADSLALNGIATLYFSSSAKTISMTSRDSTPITSNRDSELS